MVVLETIASARLRGNPRGDPYERVTPVYLPPSYPREPGRRFPTIYCLAGFAGRGLTFLNVQPFEPTLPERFAALIAAGAAPEAILVMPDGFTGWGGSEYTDSPALGDYFSHVADEVVAHVDARFRTLAAPAHRAVAGKSSGGAAALRFAMLRPDRFGACASHSGDLLFDVVYAPEFLRFCDAAARYRGLAGLLAAVTGPAPRPPDAVGLLNVIAMAAAYSPRPERDPPFALPFDLATGAPVADVLAQWLAHDPVRMARRHADALRGLRALYFDCGRRDEHHLHLGARALARTLADLGVPHEHQEFDGGHRDTGWRWDVSLAKLARAIAP